MSEEILKANLKEYWQTGLDSLKAGKYNSATELLFKAFITLCDIAIYRKLKLLPSDHGDRFDILKVNFPGIWRIDLALFDTYRKGYKLRLELDDAESVKRGVMQLAKTLGIKID